MPSELPRLVTRVPEEINKKFLYICDEEDRKASNLLGKIVKEYIDQYELKNGQLIIEEDGRVVTAKQKKQERSSIFKSG